MEVSLLEGNSTSQESYLSQSQSQSQSSNINTIDNYLIPEKHLSYFYDIANVGRKTGKRRKSVEKDSDGMDNISDFFGEDDSEEESDDPDDKDDFDTLDGYSNNGETTDGVDESNDNDNEKNDGNTLNTIENDENEINESYLYQNNKIKNNNKEISMSLDEAVERLQKIIQETPSKSKIDMTPVLNSVLKASKLNNENDSLYSYNSLQEAKLRKKIMNDNNKENINLSNSSSITHDKIYEYEEDIKDISSDDFGINNNGKDEVYETESSDDDEIIIDVSNGKRKSLKKYELRSSKYRNSDTETELDLHYSSNSDSESDVYDYESEDSDGTIYSLTNNKRNNNNIQNVINDSEIHEYQEIQPLSSRRQSSRRKTRQSILSEHFNDDKRKSINKINSNNFISINNLEQNNIDSNDNNIELNGSTSDMSITKESSEPLIKKIEKDIETNNKGKLELEKKDKEINKNKNDTLNEMDNKLTNVESDLLDKSHGSEISEAVIENNKINNNNEENNDNNFNNDDNSNGDDDDNDFNNDFNDFNIDNIDIKISNNIPNDESIQDTNEENNEIDQYDKNDKENINENDISNQANIPSLKKKSKLKSTKGKKKNSPSVSVSVSVSTNNNNNNTHKRKRYEEVEVPLRKSSRKRIPPCKYWEGERPEDLLVLNEDQIKERQIKREKEIEKQNQWTRKRKRRTRKVTKKEETEKHPPVKTVDESTSPIKGLFNPNIADFSKSLSRDFTTEITTYDVYTKEYSKRNLVATQKMLNPMPVKNSSFKFTKIFSEKPLYATGLLLFPKGSSKPNRNSKDNILIFFVMTGEIEVQVHKTVFTVYAGDHFIIPKGNQYEIKNSKDVESKLWFVQCRIRKD